MARSRSGRTEQALPGRRLAVDDLNLDIADGEFVCLVGPVGLRQDHRAADDRRARGHHRRPGAIGDRVVNDLPPRDRDIAMVFQSYALYPHMTVSENMGFGLQLRKLPKDADRQGGARRPRASSTSSVPRPQAGTALGRAAPARRPWPSDRARTGGLPDGRAALQPRRQAASADPCRDRPGCTSDSLRP